MTFAMDILRTDVVVIGAGVIGLAVAQALAGRGQEVWVLEAAGSIGSGISSRNSEVIHAGLYYPPGSLKALCCVEGRRRLYDYCRQRRVPHRRCGKLIVATSPEQLEALEQIRTGAEANGVEDLAWWSECRLRREEPALSVVGALHSPSTGIVDSHALMQALQQDVTDRGGLVVTHSPVLGVGRARDGLQVRVGGAQPCTVVAPRVINCAGLSATALLTTVEGYPEERRPALWLARGHYFTYSGAHPFRQLVYPMPEPGGLGIHLTLDLAGQARFGPDVEWIEQEDYHVDPHRAEHFHAAITRYWPGCQRERLQPAYAGIRPKLVPAGAPASDFLIDGPESHGVNGFISLLGIESPGLTSALALAERVAHQALTAVGG